MHAYSGKTFSVGSFLEVCGLFWPESSPELLKKDVVQMTGNKPIS